MGKKGFNWKAREVIKTEIIKNEEVGLLEKCL